MAQLQRAFALGHPWCRGLRAKEKAQALVPHPRRHFDLSKNWWAWGVIQKGASVTPKAARCLDFWQLKVH